MYIYIYRSRYIPISIFTNVPRYTTICIYMVLNRYNIPHEQCHALALGVGFVNRCFEGPRIGKIHDFGLTAHPRFETLRICRCDWMCSKSENHRTVWYLCWDLDIFGYTGRPFVCLMTIRGGWSWFHINSNNSKPPAGKEKNKTKHLMNLKSTHLFGAFFFEPSKNMT